MLLSDLTELLRFLFHYSLHLLVPGLIAREFFKDVWKKAWLIMLCTMLVDLDHLVATPIFDSARCSIGFHPFHSYYAIAVYFVILFIPNKNVRIIAVGLLFHMFTDLLDCLWMYLNNS